MKLLLLRSLGLILLLNVLILCKVFIGLLENIDIREFNLLIESYLLDFLSYWIVYRI